MESQAFDNHDFDSSKPTNWNALIKAAHETHPHCDNCFKLHCSALPPVCEMETCELKCGAKYHSCKRFDHNLLCVNMRVNCINCKYGCTVMMPRRCLAAHLAKCAASVVVCSVEWGRIPKPVEQAQPVTHQHLDTILAYRDQKHIEEALFPAEFVKWQTLPLHGKITRCVESHKMRLEEIRRRKKENSGEPWPLYLYSIIEFGTCYHSSVPDKYIFLCGEELRRDMFPWHFKNIHNDILCSLNGWLEHHCPLEAADCMFRQRRLYPDIPQAHLTYNQLMECFAVTYETNIEEKKTDSHVTIDLCSLPTEVLELMFNYLDPLSLANVSLTCKRLRQVCASIFLPHQGIVSLIWQIETDDLQNKRWKIVGTKWKFPKFFTPIKHWRFADKIPMVHHMNECDKYDRLCTTKPYNLTSNVPIPQSLLDASCSSHVTPGPDTQDLSYL